MRSTFISALLLIVAMGSIAAEPDAVVIQAGDITVSYQDVERYIQENTPPDPDERAQILADPDIFRKMAEMLYTVRFLAAEAEKMPDFDAEQAAWNTHMIYQRRISRDYRAKYVEHLLKDVNWEATAKEAYLAQKDLYQSDEAVNASHILIKVEPDRTDKEALKLAKELRSRALKGEDFAALASEYSEDPSAARNGGKLGYFQKGRMVKDFEEAVWDMQEEGAISEPVKSPFGYHVIQYHSRRLPAPIPFKTVKSKIVDELKTQMASKVWQDKLLAVRSSDQLKIDPALLEELKKEHQTDTGLDAKAAEKAAAVK